MPANLDDMTPAGTLELLLALQDWKTQYELAEQLGKQRTWISRRLAMISDFVEVRTVKPQGPKGGRPQGYYRSRLRISEE